MNNSLMIKGFVSFLFFSSLNQRTCETLSLNINITEEKQQKNSIGQNSPEKNTSVQCLTEVPFSVLSRSNSCPQKQQ